MNITFFQESIHDALKACSAAIRRRINELSDEEVAQTDADTICATVVAELGLPEIAEFATGEIERDEPHFGRNERQCSVRVYIPYKGDVTTFRLFDRSSPLPPPTYEIGDGFLVRTYSLDAENPAKLEKLLEEDVKLVNEYIGPVRDAIPLYNASLLNVAKDAHLRRAKELERKNVAAAKIAESNIKVRRRNDGNENIVIPVQRKAISLTPNPRPTSSVPRQVTPPEFELGMREYEDILGAMSAMIHVVERTPSVFASMGEEDLRTILLVALNGIYEGQATGETFNGHGKTDILIRRDDKNVFIAECLIWKGEKGLLSKLDKQLFRYAMWRDSKLALIVFNRSGDFSNVVKKMKAAIGGHAQCIREISSEHETGAKFEFRRHDDEDRRFLLTALAFDVLVPTPRG